MVSDHKAKTNLQFVDNVCIMREGFIAFLDCARMPQPALLLTRRGCISGTACSIGWPAPVAPDLSKFYALPAPVVCMLMIANRDGLQP